jgi:hypothetical protein
VIDANPQIINELYLGGLGCSSSTGPANQVTANRAVNAIPALCASAPGVMTMLDLPIITAACQ